MEISLIFDRELRLPHRFSDGKWVEAEHGWHCFTLTHSYTHAYMHAEANRQVDGLKEISPERANIKERREKILCYMFIHLSLFISILTLQPTYETVSVVPPCFFVSTKSHNSFIVSRLVVLCLLLLLLLICVCACVCVYLYVYVWVSLSVCVSLIALSFDSFG